MNAALTQADHLQRLIKQWCDGPWTHNEEAIAWLKSRPATIRPLMLRFPPSCIVSPTRVLRTPAPGRLGVIASYLEPDERSPEGLVTVCDLEATVEDRPRIKAQCDPSWLEPVAYWKGWTPDYLEAVLSVKQ